MAYLTQADLAARIGAHVVTQIFDDDNDGTADTDPVAAILRDAQAKVDGYLRGLFPLPLASVPNEVKRLALDVAVAYAAQRFPERVQRDWQTLMEQADRDLRALRKGETRLDIVGPPEPAGNVGGIVVPGGPETTLVRNGVVAYDPLCPGGRKFGDMGDF